jgi:hypothetical protein
LWVLLEIPSRKETVKTSSPTQIYVNIKTTLNLTFTAARFIFFWFLFLFFLFAMTVAWTIDWLQVNIFFN